MNTIPYIISDASVTVYLRGVPYTVDASHPNNDAIREALKLQLISTDDMMKLVSVRSYIKSLNIGAVTVSADSILYKNEPVHGHLATRMLEIIAAGHDVTPWAKFMDNLYLNPSKTAVDELYLWLEKSKMPITEDGHFLAYKKVQDDYTSYHKNADGSECRNDIGTMVQMPRYQVDDRRHNTCSTGLHFCSFEYLPHYMGNQGKVLVLKINPADVVSIPSDYDNAKGRASQYLVFSEVEESKTAFAFAGTPVYDTSPAEAGDDFYGDDEFDDDEFDDTPSTPEDLWRNNVDNELTELGFADWLDEQRAEWREAVDNDETTIGFDEWLRS